MMNSSTAVLIASLSLAFSGAAFSAVSPDEAKQLGGAKLTTFGAEKAGNKEGTIPAYSGKAPKAPASYNPKDPGQRPDPYGDKPLFSITAQNADKYADKLDAMVELFKKYPNYRMDIYPTHRDFAYPQYFLDNSIKNATSCKGTNNELKLEGCYGGMPFPIPKTGYQAMWNHMLQFHGHAYSGVVTNWITPTDGKAVLQTVSDVAQQFDHYNPNNKQPSPSNTLYRKFWTQDIAPARKVGGKLLALFSLDMMGGDRIYQYIAGQRRVKLAPNLAYDTPNPFTGGASIMDDSNGFLGAMDRFDFKLVGKKEKYIMYNNFDMTNHKACSAEKIVNNKNFPNPDCVRWELHRVWVVEATLKPGFRHVYAKRVFFWDEDMPMAGSSENYDAGGKLYRMTHMIAFPYYDHELGGNGEGSIYLDLQTGAWAVQALPPGEGNGWHFTPAKDDRFFSPEALSGDGLR